MAASINLQDQVNTMEDWLLRADIGLSTLQARNCLLHFEAAGNILLNKRLASRIRLDNIKYEANHDEM